MSLAVRDSAGISMPIIAVGRQDKLVKEQKLDQLLFEEASVLRLRDQCIAKIRNMRPRNTSCQREFPHILYRWAEWTTDEEVRAWTATVIANPDRALEFLRPSFNPLFRQQVMVQHG